MKSLLLRVVKVVVPLALGVWLVIYFYRQLDPQQRGQLFEAFRKADTRWLWLTLLLGWLSHVSRAWRWRYLLSPMGYRPGFWNAYHAVMIGYFMNMLLPRAGEASRAVMLYRSDKVPFDRGFGTIMAERAIDFAMLLGVAGITLVLQVDKLEVFRARLLAFRMGRDTQEGLGPWWLAIGVMLVLLIATGVFLILRNPVWRARAMDTLRGFGEGLRSVFHTRNKGGFLLHTFIIWFLYVAMFWTGFYCLPSTAHLGAAAVFAGFVAGSVGIILVQGGIGAYPAFVALIVSIYMSVPEGGGSIHPEALAMGWLLWVVQALLLIVLGGLSLLLAARGRPRAASSPE